MMGGWAFSDLEKSKILNDDGVSKTSVCTGEGAYGMHSFHKMPTVIDVTTPDLARTS